MTAPRTIDERERWMTEEAFRLHASQGRRIEFCRLQAEVLCDLLFGTINSRQPKGITSYGRGPLEDAKRQIQHIQRRRRRGRGGHHP